MLVDLVATVTKDKFRLDGAYFSPTDEGSRVPIDALLWLHGGSINFYHPFNLELSDKLSAAGIAVLSANRRGHDWVTWGAQFKPSGFAFELVPDAIVDVSAWLDLLRERGHRRVAIGGHSGGAVGVVYAQAASPFDDVAAVIAVSPPEYTQDAAKERFGEKFSAAYTEALRAVDDGRGGEVFAPGVPIPPWYTYSAYVDAFHPDGRYSVSARASELSVPALYAFASNDAPLCLGALARMAETEYLQATVVTIDGADHMFSRKVPALAEVILRWLDSLEASPADE